MILISACLCGCKCTYKGTSHYHPVFYKLYKEGKAVVACPERLGGLPVPRSPAEIVGGDGSSVLKGLARVITKEGRDVTPCFLRGAKETLRIARDAGAIVAVLKSSSPSCGVGQVYDGTFSGNLRGGNGVTSALLKEYGLAIMNDEEFLLRQEEMKEGL
ncbi:MAG TPA: DUF523 domain-containing protein [Syntrophothermus lipocalidus]|nr:DUF523 domain-containing protein [Syntrophothermus lipocalidus]